ncbi:MAG: RNA polymerase sigma factor, partial [Bryobacteraceae bacterium]
MTGAIAGEREGRVRVGVDLSDFGSWMASEQKRIYLLCRRLLQDPEEADSATQDVFLKAYKLFKNHPMSLRRLDYPDRWVTRIAVNTCLDRLRSKAWKIWQRRPSAEDEKVILEMTPGSDPDAER